MDQLIQFLAQTNDHTGRQTNFKLSHGNTINNSITMKAKLFQQQEQQERKSEHSVIKVMAEQ